MAQTAQAPTKEPPSPQKDREDRKRADADRKKAQRAAEDARDAMVAPGSLFQRLRNELVIAHQLASVHGVLPPEARERWGRLIREADRTTGKAPTGGKDGR